MRFAMLFLLGSVAWATPVTTKDFPAHQPLAETASLLDGLALESNRRLDPLVHGAIAEGAGVVTMPDSRRTSNEVLLAYLAPEVRLDAIGDSVAVRRIVSDSFFDKLPSPTAGSLLSVATGFFLVSLLGIAFVEQIRQPS